MSALTTPTYSNKIEKKKKRNEQKETPTSDQKPNKGKEQDHLKKTSLGPLRQGQRPDTSETKQSSSKERKLSNQSSKTTRSSPCTHANSPWTKATPPGRMHAKHHLKQGSYNNSALTGQTGHHHRSDRCSTCAQDQHSDRSDRWPRPVRPVHNRAQKWLKTTWKPSKCIQQAISSSNVSPLLAMHESSQKCKTFNLELLK
jgi:hypothetical protein